MVCMQYGAHVEHQGDDILGALFHERVEYSA